MPETEQTAGSCPLRTILFAAALLLALPLPALLTHTSQSPTIAGLYSESYLAFLIVYLALVLTTALLTAILPWLGEQRLCQSMHRLLSQRFVYWFLLIAPWPVLVIVVEQLETYEFGRLAVVQLPLLCLVVLFDLSVVLIGNAQETRRETVAKVVILAISVALSLGLMELMLRQFPALIPTAARPHLPGGGRFLRSDLLFDQPIQVGFRYQPLVDRPVSYRVSDGDLYRLYQVTSDGIKPIPPNQDIVLAQSRFVTDENGYPNAAPLSELYDAVVLGDSFGAPGTVEKPWPEIVSQLSGLSVLNLSMPGYGPQAEVQSGLLYGLPKDPQWVIIAYFEGNDLTDAEQYAIRQKSGRSWADYDVALAGPYRSSVALQSMRYGIPDLLNKAVVKLRMSPTVAQTQPTEPSAYRFPVEASIAGQEVPLVWSPYFLSLLTATEADIEASNNYREVRQSLLDLNANVSEDAHLLMVYIPTKEHVYLPLLQQGQAWSEALEGTAPITLGSTGFLTTGTTGDRITAERWLAHVDDQRIVLSELAKKVGLDFLDLTPIFQAEAAKGSELYYTFDTHWNQSGHELAAHAIAAHVRHAKRDQSPQLINLRRLVD